MKILITGIGNVGKSTLREKIAADYPDLFLQIDMDYYREKELPDSSGRSLLVEDVHGLEKNPEQFDKIIYLMPPPNHIYLWLKRAWAWFASGRVDLSAPKGINKKYAIQNIPIIFKIVLKNILLRKKWLKNDMKIIERTLQGKVVIIENPMDLEKFKLK